MSCVHRTNADPCLCSSRGFLFFEDLVEGPQDRVLRSHKGRTMAVQLAVVFRHPCQIPPGAERTGWAWFVSFSR